MATTLPFAVPERRLANSTILSLDAAPTRCLLLDAGEQCVLQESLKGFDRGLAAASIPFERVSRKVLTFLSSQGPTRAGLQRRRYSGRGILAVCCSRRSLLAASGAESGTPGVQFRKVGEAEAPPFSDYGEKYSLRTSQLVIIPGALMDSLDLATTIRRLACGGMTILYESGAAYAAPKAFEAEQCLLQDYFGLPVEAPQELWPARAGTGRLCYVRYHWPTRAMIRDFSRVIAVSRQAASSSSHIAYIGTAPIAGRRPIGKGTFIYLGSPLGPHVGFGDPEAHRLLEIFVRSSEAS
jgi:hypothetical protein